VQTGCFPGDAPGFPVTITQEASYVLTSKLDLTGLSPAPSAIRVLSSRVTIDLGGFGIVGPCLDAPTCPAGTGHGIDGGGATGDPVRVAVRNGYIEGMPGHGILLSSSAFVSEVFAIGNGLDGVQVQTASRVTGVSGSANGEDGIDVDERIGETSAVLGDYLAFTEPTEESS
jgi:hypothetical protein